MSKTEFDGLNIAVLLPCYNEGQTIADVVLGFRRSLPTARIFVYDNNSADNTSEQAARAGATVVPCRRQGKGNVVRMMFADIDADIYLMADGDGTYDPKDGPVMVRTLLEERVDMVVGTRKDVTEDAGRKGHAFGNKMFNKVYHKLFGKDFTDIFSGYRTFTRRYAKSFPAVSPGFEIETEMSVHASVLRLPIKEIELDYGRRPEGSESKLNSFQDGFKILMMMGRLMRQTKPFAFFSVFALSLLIVGIWFGAAPVVEYFKTGLVTQVPTWILAMALIQGAGLLFVTGLILDSVASGRAEAKRIHYLSIPKSRGEQFMVGTEFFGDRRTDLKPKTADRKTPALRTKSGS